MSAINQETRQRRLHLALILITLLAGTWLRLWRLAELPPGFYYDEAYNAMDGLWMQTSLTPQAYFVGNTGRHAMMPYLIALSTSIWGVTPLAARLVAPLAGVLAIALLYRLALTLFAQRPARFWLALLSAAGLAFSFWHVVMSRTAYEATLVPPFLILTSLLFWRGWQRRSLWYFAGAGLALGLTQYTYVSGRLVPLVFGLFVLIWSGLALLSKQVEPEQRELRTLWRGLGVMALASIIPFVPLGLFILNDFGAFFFRSSDVFILNRMAQGQASAVEQLVTAWRVFIDSYSNTWRHNIVGQGGFSWISIIGFGVGLATAAWQLRRPAYIFLLVALFVMWLPAPLSSGISTLRLSGMLPVYFIIGAIGLLKLTGWAAHKLPLTSASLNLILVGLFFLVAGGGTAYNYFVRWANEPEVYQAYQGRYANLGRYLVEESHTHDILLPFDLYVNPTIRFMLYDEFGEVKQPPPLREDRPLVFVKQSKNGSSTLVWLSRDRSGQGLTYVTRALPPAARDELTAIGNTIRLESPANGETIGLITPYQSIKPLYDQLTAWPAIRPVQYSWGQELRLFGYELWPQVVPRGRSPVLNLYWQSLVGQPHAWTQFIQLVDRDGRPVAQWTDAALTDQHRWRTGGLVPEQRVLWLSPEAAPGPYLIRLGLFDYSTGRRVPIISQDGTPVGDQTILGLFYVVDDDKDPRLPEKPVEAMLNEQIEFLGYSPALLQPGAAAVKIKLHWQAQHPIGQDYTIFVQLLDSQGQRVSGWDAQPLNGLYPTSAWQPGEIVVDEFELPVPDVLAAGDYSLVTGMYDLATGQRLPVTDPYGQSLGDNMIKLTQVTIP